MDNYLSFFLFSFIFFKLTEFGQLGVIDRNSETDRTSFNMFNKIIFLINYMIINFFLNGNLLHDYKLKKKDYK